MSIIAPRTGSYTFEDFLAVITPDQKADLLDGVIYMASPEGTEDNKLGGWLYRLMSEYVERLDLGEVFYTRVAFRITNKRGPEPDVAFVSQRRLHRVEKGYVDGAPDIAVEIVSPDSVERDYEKKRLIYEKAGVKEYWIVDPGVRGATFLRRIRGKFQEVKRDGTIFESTVLRGFKIDVRWLWSKRRPTVMQVINDLTSE